MEEKNYEHYKERLNSYNEKKWPTESPVYIKELAEAGLVYTGQKDIVFCFRCGITVFDWREGDDPLQRHEMLNKQCPFLLHRSKSVHPASQKNDSKFCKSLEDFERESLLYDWDPQHNVAVVRRNIITQCSTTEDSRNIIVDGESKNSCHNPPHMSKYNEKSDLPGLAHEHMRYQAERFSSFAVCPVEKHWPSPELLSAAGFFYRRECGNMACFCCGVMVDSWESSNQDAVKRHQSISPTCAFITGKPCGDVPDDFEFTSEMRMLDITTERNLHILPEQAHLDSNSLPSANAKTAIYFEPEPIGEQDRPSQVQIAIPAMDMSDKAKRLETFITYPRDAAVQPVELAEAGFFYIGRGDGVRCYECDTCLKQFEEGDRAWSEHSRYSPACPLVIEHLRKKNGMAYRNNYVETNRLPPDPRYPNPDPRYPPTLEPRYTVQSNGHHTNPRFSPQHNDRYTQRLEYPEQVWNDRNVMRNGYHHGSYDDNFSNVPQMDRYNRYTNGSTAGPMPSVQRATRPTWVMPISNPHYYRPNMPPQRVPSIHTIQRYPSQKDPRRRIPLHHQMSSPLSEVSDRSDHFVPVESHVRHNSAPSIVNPITNKVNIPRSSSSGTSSPNPLRHNQTTENGRQVLDSISQADMDKLLDMGFKREAVLKTIDCYMGYSPKPFKRPDDLAQAVMYFAQHGDLERSPFGKNLAVDPSEAGEGMICERAKRKNVDEVIDGKNCDKCIICLDADVEVTFVPCGHLVVCQSCALGVKDCPICRIPIKQTVRTYFFRN